MRMLVVEDDAVIAGLVRQGLEQARLKVTVATDEPSGLRAAREGGFGVILLDVLLPGMDGWSLCEALRARGVEALVPAHGGEARPARDRFLARPARDRFSLLAFLNSL